MQITKEEAHIIHDENLFIDHVNPTIVPNRFESTFTIDGKHAYFYENQATANHVTGANLVDALRQLFKAICHHFFDVPLEYRFVLHNVQMDFKRYTKLKVPIHVVADVQTRSSEVRGQFRLTGETQVVFYQGGMQTCKVIGQFTAFSPEVENLIMSRQYAQLSRKLEKKNSAPDTVDHCFFKKAV